VHCCCCSHLGVNSLSDLIYVRVILPGGRLHHSRLHLGARLLPQHLLPTCVSLSREECGGSETQLHSKSISQYRLYSTIRKATRRLHRHSKSQEQQGFADSFKVDGGGKSYDISANKLSEAV